MYNFITNFIRLRQISKDFAKNRINELGNISRRGVIPKFSDLDVIALGITVEYLGNDSENYLFYPLHKDCKKEWPHQIIRRQFNARRKLTSPFAENIINDVNMDIEGIEVFFCFDSKSVNVYQNARVKHYAKGWNHIVAASDWACCVSQEQLYFGNKLHAVCGIKGIIYSYYKMVASTHAIHYLNYLRCEYHDCIILGYKGFLTAEIQKNIFEVVNISLEAPYMLNQMNWRPASWAYKQFRKRNKNSISQLKIL